MTQVQIQFFLQNAHFVINTITALVFFAISWLYFDAWLVKKHPHSSIKWIGFLLVSLSFLSHSVHVEQIILVSSIFGEGGIEHAAVVLRLIGYILIAISLLGDHLQKRPETRDQPFYLLSLLALLGGVSFFSTLYFLNAVFCVVISFLYLRRATIGLENHLKPVTVAFMLLALSDIISLPSLFSNTGNPALDTMTAPFGSVWITSHIILCFSSALLARWVFHYLTKRIQSQLFMIMTTGILVVFLITTLTFTMLLLRGIENDQLKHLRSDVGVLQYAVNTKQEQTLSDAELVAQNPDIALAVLDRNTAGLRALTKAIMLSKMKTNLIILDENGVVLMRAEDDERYGDSLSSDRLFKRAKEGSSLSTISIYEGVIAPSIGVRSAAPIEIDGEIFGVVIVGSAIDNAFVDGIKEATSLETAIYAGNIRSATTFVAPDGKSRWIGIQETDKKVTDTVLASGEVFVGSLNIMNTPHLVSFAPLLDADNIPVGMLFVGEKHSKILRTAGESIQITFLVSAILLVISIIPSFLLARLLTKQLQ